MKSETAAESAIASNAGAAEISPALLLAVLAVACFGTSVIVRILDPMVPDIARSLAADPHTIALLASAFAFPYAFGQPLLGPLGDALGKSRIIKVSIGIVVATLVLSALAPTSPTLFAARILGGLAAGGIIPLSLAMVGDRVPIENRQLALSRILVASLSGQIVGSLGAGLLGPVIGWRAVVLVGAALLGLALAVVMARLVPRPRAERVPFALSTVERSYRVVFANPRSIVCFAAVFVEGLCIFGLVPYLAVLLEQAQTGGIREAGFVLGGLGVGGIIYAAAVRWLLTRLGGQMNVIRVGGLVCGLGLALYGGTHTPLMQAIMFVVIGVGFYMIHNSLQTQATELAPTARGAAVGLHAFSFFLGQAAGPPLYGAGLASAGTAPTLLTGAFAMGLLGLVTAHLLIRRTPTA
jgi:predicted MFS family arabinose efflux permease